MGENVSMVTNESLLGEEGHSVALPGMLWIRVTVLLTDFPLHKREWETTIKFIITMKDWKIIFQLFCPIILKPIVENFSCFFREQAEAEQPKFQVY